MVAPDGIEITLASLPLDIIRMIIPMTESVHKMRQISPTWEIIVVDLIKNRRVIIDRLDLHFDRDKKLKINVKIRKCFLPCCHFDQWHVEMSSAHDINFTNPIEQSDFSNDQNRFDLVGYPLVIWSPIWSLLVLAKSKSLAVTCSSIFGALGMMAIWRELEEKWDEEERIKKSKTKLAELMQDLLDYTYRVKLLVMTNVNHCQFKRISRMFESARIDQLIVSVSKANMSSDLQSIKDEAKKMNAKHTVVT